LCVKKTLNLDKSERKLADFQKSTGEMAGFVCRFELVLENPTLAAEKKMRGFCL